MTWEGNSIELGGKVMYARAKWHRVSLLIFSIVLIASRRAAAQAGQLDPTFGTGGIVTTDFGLQTYSNIATANAVVIQPDGKIVVCGGAPTSTGFPNAVVARYNTNGTLDTGFGTGGIAMTNTFSILSAIALQPDGKIVVDGFAGETLVVIRYTANGSLDPTFGTGGIASFIALDASTSGLLIQPDGKIVVANHALTRLLSNGQLDSTFGTGGSVKVAGYNPTAVALLTNGKLLVATAFGNSGFVTRYDSNGSLDTSFAVYGQLATAGSGNAMVLLRTGEFLVGGSLISSLTELNQGFGTSTGFTVSRYQGAGIADGTFATHGGVLTPLTDYPNVLTSGLGVQSTGDIVVLGTAANDIEPLAFALARYTAAGQLDTAFGTGGIVITSFGSSTFATANGLAIQSDNKIVAVGGYTTSEQGDFDTGFKLTRYLSQ